MMPLSRRSLITGLVSLVAAPAIVRASSLMPVRALVPVPIDRLDVLFGYGYVRPDWIILEAVEMFKNSNAFIRHLVEDYDNRGGSYGCA